MDQPEKPNSGNYIVWTSLGIVVAAFLFSARDGGESFLGIVGSLWTILFMWAVVLSACSHRRQATSAWKCHQGRVARVGTDVLDSRSGLSTGTGF